MRVFVLVVTLAVISGCQGKSFFHGDPAMTWEEYFQNYFTALNTKADEIVKDIRSSQISRELETLIQDSMAELSAYRADLEDKLAPSVRESAERLDKDLREMLKRLRERASEAREQMEQYRQELQTVVVQNSDDVRRTVATYTRKMNKRLNKDAAEFKRQVASYLEKLQFRTSNNIEDLMRSLGTYFGQVRDNTQAKITTLNDLLKSQVESLKDTTQTTVEDITTRYQKTSQDLYDTLTGSRIVDTVNSRLARVQKNYKLEGSVKVWSDFLRIHFHPRTISVIHQYNHDGEADRLEAFGQGEALLQGAVLEDLDDKLHFFVEECDYFQGFQVLCDLTDGFAGLGSKVTEMLQDAYGGRGILTFGTAPVSHPNSTPTKDLYHLLNCALGMVHMASHSSFFCPLTLRGGLGLRPSSPISFPYLNYDPSLWYHSSSILSLALDALTVPYRLRSNCIPMWQLADSLSTSGRKVVAAYGAVPFPITHGSSLPDALCACDSLPWQPLSACAEAADGRCYGQWVTLKGLEGQSLTSSVAPGKEPPSRLHNLHSGEDVLASYITSFYPTAPLALQLVSRPSKVIPPFPQIFSQSLNDRGLQDTHLLPTNPLAAPPGVSSVPVITSLQSGPVLDPWLSELHRSVSAFDIRRVAPSFLSQGPEMADYSEALEQLRLLARKYRDDSGGVTRSSSEDDDD